MELDESWSWAKQSWHMKKLKTKDKAMRNKLGKAQLMTQLEQLAYSWIVHQSQVGTSLGRSHNLLQFQIWYHFWILLPKLQGAMYLICCRT